MKRGIQIIGLWCMVLLTGMFLRGRGLPRPPWPRLPAVTNVILTWTYEGAATFNVRCLKTNQFAAPWLEWQVITNTAAHSVAVPIDRSARCVWFAVTAVDPQTGLESDFAW